MRAGRKSHRWSYLLSIAAVGGLLVLLPAFYFGLVAGSAWLVWQHVMSHWNWCASSFGALVYLLPIFLGALWLVALVKPFCTRPPQYRSAHRVARSEQPQLYALVDSVARNFGVKPPKYIEVDHEANASAKFGDDYGDFITGTVTVLTIGLPLLAGLQVEQLAGVIAHECGHFRQRGAMRLSAIIRWVARWFASIVHHRDDVDARSDFRPTKLYLWPAYVLGGFVWIARWMLWGSLLVSRAAAAYLLRQMELDADRYEVQLVGTDTFLGTATRMHELALAQETALDDMLQSFRDGYLTNHYPALILAECEQLGHRLSAATHNSARHEKTAWLDTHPCDAERKRNALAEPCPGAFKAPDPARTLMQDFDALCELVTRDLNYMLFGEASKRARVVELGEFLQRNNDELEDLFALKRLFAGSFNVLRGMRTPPRPESGVYVFERAIDILIRTSRIMSTHRETFVDRAKRFYRFDAILRETSGALDFAHASSNDGRSFEFRQAVNHEQHSEIRSALQRLDGQMARFDSLFWTRVGAALELLRSPIAGEICAEPRQLIREASLMWQAAYRLHSVVPVCSKLDQQLNLFESLLEISQLRGTELLQTPLEEVSHMMAEELRQVSNRLKFVVYPFELKSIRSVSDYLFEDVPTDEQSVLAAAYGFVDRFPALYARVIGRLARIAENVESAVRRNGQPASD